MLDYENIKNRYRVVTVDLSRQKELDPDRKAIQQTEFAGQLKNAANTIVAGESACFNKFRKKSKKQD